MFCPKCGADNSDSSFFCKNCGTALNQNMSYASPAGESAYSAPISRTFAGAVIKTLSSPKMLALCILCTVSACWGIFSAFFGNAISESVLSQIFYEYGIYIPQDGMITPFSVIGLIVFVPAALIITGLWMTFSAAKNADMNGGMKTGGISVIKVVFIIEIICTVILSLLVALVIGMTAAMGDAVTLPATYSDRIDGFDSFGGDFGGFDFAPYSGFDGAMTVLAILICIVIFIALAFRTVFLALAVRECTNTAKTARFNEFYRNTSMGLTVLAFICAGANLLLGSFISGASYVLFAIVLLDMRSNINSVLFSPQTMQL